MFPHSSIHRGTISLLVRWLVPVWKGEANVWTGCITYLHSLWVVCVRCYCRFSSSIESVSFARFFLWPQFYFYALLEILSGIAARWFVHFLVSWHIQDQVKFNNYRIYSLRPAWFRGHSTYQFLLNVVLRRIPFNVCMYIHFTRTVPYFLAI